MSSMAARWGALGDSGLRARVEREVEQRLRAGDRAEAVLADVTCWLARLDDVDKRVIEDVLLAAIGRVLQRERVRALRALSEERAARVAATDGLVHDARGPLTVASASALLLVHRLADPGLRRLASRVVQSVQRTDALLRDALDASRASMGHLVPLELRACDLSELVRDLAEELSLLHGSRFDLLVEDHLEGVWCARALRRALFNLASNAVQHGAADAQVAIEVARVPDGVRVSVSNAGPPLGSQELAALFQPFRRGSSSTVGWGLGLAQVRACVEAHGGNVEAHSDPTCTTFTILLPIDARPYYEGSKLSASQGYAGSLGR